MLKNKFTAWSLSICTVLGASAAWAHEGHGPSDAEIAHIVVTANTIDVDAGKFAKSRTKNEEVKQFAQLMVTDHGAVNQQAVALAQKLGVTPKNNDTSRSLLKQAHEHAALIKKLKGKEFDVEYVNHEVAYHEAVLDALDKTLIPGAHNAELKELIVKVRPAFVAHLEHAKQLQSKLKE